MRRIYQILVFTTLVFASVKMQAQCGNTLTTPWTWNNGQAGIMFAVSAKNSIVIDSFDINWDAGTYGYQIYYKTGTFIGFDVTPGAWTMVGSGTATSTGGGSATNLSASLNIVLNKFETGSFYITTTTGTPCNYTNGTSVCDSLFGNADLNIYEGYGKAYPFAATFNPREFSGRVYYHCAPSPTYSISSPPLCNITPGQVTQLYISPPISGVTYNWTFPAGVTAQGSTANDTVTVQFSSSAVTGNVCVTLSSCGPITTICSPLQTAPQVVDAGPDTSICGSTYQMQPNGTYGVWTIISGSGSITNPNLYNTTVTNLGQGINVFKWYSNPPGCVEDSDFVSITVNPIPVALFSPPDACDGTALNFSENSYALGGVLTDWFWDVDGDGATDYTSSSFTHTYQSAGVYQCTLMVAASLGCMDTIVQDVYVHPIPVANFNNVPQCEGSPMSFVDVSTVATGSITGWSWNFGDNTPLVYTQSPQHLYDSANFYLVGLMVTSDQGCTDFFTDSIEVYSVPDPMFSVNDTCYNDTFRFKDLSTSVQGVINYWEWDFGDGSPKRFTQNANYVYSTHALYNATLTVATNKGCTNTVALPVKAYPAPVPDFSRLYECEKQEMRFTENGYVDGLFGSTVAKWSWQFGDGGTANTQSVGYFYQNPGNYNVTLTTTSNYGCDTKIVRSILVRPKPDAQFLVTGDKSCAGNEIDFNDETYFDYTYDQVGVVKWKWTFGDGLSSTLKDSKHSYFEGGTYTASLAVETKYGCIDTAFKEVIVYSNPEAGYDIDTLENCSPHCAVFIDNSKISGGDTLLYQWTFGDGNTANEVNPTHCYYAEDGTGSQSFDTQLKVYTKYGCNSIFSYEKPLVVNANPIANFVIEQDSLDLLDPTVFVSNYSEGGNYYLWDFGDSNSSFSVEPISHEYAQAGSYQISLLVETSEGCFDKVTRNIYIDHHRSLFIPSGFTPNGDHVNDVFTIQGEGLEYTKLTVFNRWGEIIYQAENDEIAWDGTYKGQLLPIGSYAYIIEYKFIGETPGQKSGAFSLSSTGVEY